MCHNNIIDNDNNNNNNENINNNNLNNNINITINNNIDNNNNNNNNNNNLNNNDINITINNNNNNNNINNINNNINLKKNKINENLNKLNKDIKNNIIITPTKNNHDHNVNSKTFKSKSLFFNNNLLNNYITTSSILHYKSNDIAIELTLICFSIFKKCRAKEFLNLNWSKSTKNILSPNVVRMIVRSNLVSSWVAQEILNQENIKERAEYLKLFIKVANDCVSLNNFNTLFDIFSGLNSAAIHRLKKTWALLPKESLKIFEYLEELTSTSGNFHILRSNVDSIKDNPCIPYIGIYLTVKKYIFLII
jgi:hypothetical protein